MKLTLGWLKEHLDTAADIDTISERLTAIGLEVEEITDRTQDYEGLIVADVVACSKHPDADRLNVCTVDTGSEKLQVICGAPNVRKGLRICFAPVGARIPAWPEHDNRLKQGVIRGLESNGMCCSEAELCLSDESNGIMELDTDVPAGTPFAYAMGLDDPIIDISLTPNRADCAGVRGIARDLAAAGVGTLKPLKVSSIKGTFKSPVDTKLDFTADKKHACPYFVGRTIRGVKNGTSPKWMQDRLIAAGLRPISTLVDITNYICLEYNRPLHVFDIAKLSGDITIRMGKGEKFLALNEKEYIADENDIVVADNNKVLAIGGVMGGEDCGASANTTDVYIEVAYFDPDHVRVTGAKHQITSEARYRFERGVDPSFLNDAAELTTQLILDLCGGEPSELVVAGGEPNWQRIIEFDTRYVAQLSGVDVPQDGQIAILHALGFTVEKKGDTSLVLTPPSWRGDIEGRADIVEEIIRIYGYDKVPSLSVRNDSAVMKSAFSPEKKRSADMVRLLASRGMNEAVTWSFTDEKTFADFSFSDKKKVKIANPLSADWDTMRHSILGNLLQGAQRNASRSILCGSLFEMGPVFFGQSPDDQPEMIAGLRYGSHTLKGWNTGGRGYDVFDAKADVASLLTLAGLNPDNVPISTDAPSWYHPGRSGVFRLGKNVIAVFGEIHPALCEKYDLDMPVCGFEVFVDNLPAVKVKATATKPKLELSSLQPVNRDFAFIMAQDVPANKLVRAAESADKNLIVSVRLFDVYQGKGVEEGKKSMAITVTLQPFEATLTDAEIEGVSQKIIANVEKQTGGTLRG